MTNKQALREAAQKAAGAYDRLSIIPADDIFDISLSTLEGDQLDADITALNVFNESANPAAVLALLDELEAKDKRIAELEAREVKLPLFDGYVPHIANELQAAFRIACSDAGIRINGEG